MKKILICSLVCLLLLPVVAVASTIGLNTNASTYTITADTLSPSEGSSTQNVSTLGGGWASALSNSSWIAPLANQGSQSEADTGYVAYSTTFSLSSPPVAASLNINYLADDWTTILLNGTTIYTGPAGAGCGTPGTSCLFDPASWSSVTDLTFTSLQIDPYLHAGNNTLTFDVSNTGDVFGSDSGGGPTGLDAQVTLNGVSAVPEPSSLLLLGSGMLTAGGFIRRRFRLMRS